MKPKTFRLIPLALTLVFSALLSACGNYPGNPNIRKAPLGSNSSGSFLTNSTAQGACTETANILPENDVTFDGRDHFIACSKTTAKFRIWGESSSGSQQLCMFPAQMYENGQIWIKKDPQGNPLSLCGAVDAENGTDFNFEYTNYNAIFVAPISSKPDMMACLGANNPLMCPHHSFGRFR